MQGHDLPPQYRLPASALTAAAASAFVAAAGQMRSRSPSPSPGHARAPSSDISSVGPIPGAFSYSPYVVQPSAPIPSAPSTSQRIPRPSGTRHRIVETVPRAERPLPSAPPPVVTIRPESPSPTRIRGRSGVRELDPFDSPSLTSPRDEASCQSSSSSRAAVEDATPLASAPGSPASFRVTPRKRRPVVKNVRSPRGVAAPRRDRERRERERERDRAREYPSLMNTLEYLITPLRLLLWPVRAALSPVLGHALNALLLLTLVAALLYAATAQLRSVFPLVATTALFPLRAVSTPTCLIANVGCSLSLLRGQDGRAQPFWRLFGHDGHVDVAAVSRSLSSEVRVAKDIFDSLVSLGDGRMMEGLAHIRIHELGIAIQTGSTLDDRYFIGQELVQLADTASSVADEIVKINAMSVSIFSWLFWEFSHVVKLLDLPEHSRPSLSTLGSRLNSLVARLDADLDRLHQRVGHAIPVAERGAQQGWTLHEHLSFIRSDLRAEHEKYPTWQRALEAGKKFFAGGDPGKLTRISRDLEITHATIAGITETRNSLERVRIGLVAFRDQVRQFSASVMGLHLGADIAVGLGPVEELAILSTVVGELGTSVGRAKQVDSGEARYIDAGSYSGY